MADELITPRLDFAAYHRDAERILADARRIDEAHRRLEKASRVAVGGGGVGGRGGGGGRNDSLSGFAAGFGTFRMPSALTRLPGVLGSISGPAAAATAAVGLLAAGVLAVGAASIRASDEYKGWITTLEFGTGSLAAAKQEMEFVSEAAFTLGIDVGAVAETYSKWAAITKGTSLEGQETRDIFYETARAVTVLGGSTEDVKGVLMALTQVLGKGKLQAEEYRGQIGDRAPIAMKAFVKASGLTEAAFLKQMEQGKVLSEEILPKYDDALRELLGNSEPANTASRGFERVKNELFLLAASIGDKLGPALGDALTGLAELVRHSRPFVEFWIDQGFDVIDILLTSLERVTGVGANMGKMFSATITILATLTDWFSRLGGVRGIFDLISAAVLNSAASIVDFAGALTDKLLSAVGTVIKLMGALMHEMTQIPGIGKYIEPVRQNLRDLGEAFIMVGKDAKKSTAETSASLRAAADTKVDELADRLGKGIERVSDHVADLGRNTKGFRQEAEELPKILQNLIDEIDAFEKAALFMEEFGISAEQAKKAAKVLATDGVKLTKDEVIALVKEWDEAKDHLEDLDKARKALESYRDEMETLRNTVALVREFGATSEEAADAAELMKNANVDAATALEMVRARAIAIQEVDLAQFGGFLSEEDLARMTEGIRLMDAVKSRHKLYREELERASKLLAEGMITPEAFAKYKKQLQAQMEGWERVAEAAISAAERAGGAWGKVLSKLGEHMDRLVAGMDMLANIAASRGDQSTAQIIGGVSGIVQGDYGAGVASLAQGFGLTGGGVSQFGGRNAGNMMAEGAQLGNTIWPGWGALIGAVVGAFVKTGADDFHSEMKESAGKAGLVISQAEGELGEVGEQIKAFVDGFLNTLQSQLLADLDLGGSQIHIREDRVRVVSNGVEKVFHDLDEAIDFFLRGILQANAGVEGLGEEVRNFFEGASQWADLGDPEKLQRAFDLAKKLDFESTGVDEGLIRQQREELALAAEFGISLHKVVDLRNKELAAVKASLMVQARSILGATDWAGQIQELTRGMEVYNNTTARQREVDQERVKALQALIAAEQDTTAGAGELTGALHDGTSARDAANRALEDGGEALDGYTRGVDDSRRAQIEAARKIKEWQEEIDALNESLSKPLDPIAVEEFAKLWEKTVADAGLSLIGMIQAVEGPASHVEEQRKLQHTIFMLQLGAQIQAAIVVLETMQFVSEASRALFAGLIQDAQKLFDDLASGRKKLPTGTGGRGGGAADRRKQEQEEAARAAEEAAQRLAEFTDELHRLELNARSFGGTLGDLAQRLAEMSETARQAAEDGAAAEDVRRFQQLSLRQEREQLLEPFQATKRENFVSQSIDIEKQRRDAIEAARLIAEAQAEALGIPFEAAFAAMEAEINRGADRMKAQLVRSVVDNLGLPLEETRRQMQDFRAAMKDLELAYRSGEISERRYLDLVKQVQDAQAQALGQDLLGLLDRYYKEVEGREDFRQRLEQANFEIELANLRLRYNILVAEGALAEEAAAEIGGFLDWVKENPPDWDAFFSPPEEDTRRTSAAAPSFTTAVDSFSTGFQSILDAIRGFVADFQRVGVGPFVSMAQDFLNALSGFATDVDQGLGTIIDGYSVKGRLEKVARGVFGSSVKLEDLTREQLEQLSEMEAQGLLQGFAGWRDGMAGIIDSILALQDAEELKPQAIQNILNAYRGTVETTNELQRRYDAINAEFLDAVDALSMMGASAEQLAEAEAIHQERIRQFWEEALAGLRGLADDIRGGEFGGVSNRARVDAARARVEELRARIEADPTDFEALSQIEEAVRALIDAERDFTGGVGPDFDRVIRELLGFIDGIEIPDPADAGATPPEAAPALLDKMDEQSQIFTAMSETLIENRDLQGAMLDAMNRTEEAAAWTQRLYELFEARLGTSNPFEA